MTGELSCVYCSVYYAGEETGERRHYRGNVRNPSEGRRKSRLESHTETFHPSTAHTLYGIQESFNLADLDWGVLSSEFFETITHGLLASRLTY